MDEIVAMLTTAELEQVIKIVGRSPTCYPPGAYAALKGETTANLASTRVLPWVGAHFYVAACARWLLGEREAQQRHQTRP